MPEKILIPILYGNENNKAFLLEAAKNCRRVVLVHIFDSSKVDIPAGEIGGEMRLVEELMDEIEDILRRVGKIVRRYNEWGPLREKLKIIAKREKVEEIVIFDQGEQTFQDLRLLQGIKVAPVRTVKFPVH